MARADGDNASNLIATSFLEELRARLSMSQIVGRRVKLAKAGREFKGLCPFHNEKTPSFYVNDEKQMAHCFGCGWHGDIIGFTMRRDGLQFVEAVETLAGIAGLQMPKRGPRDEAAEAARARVLACLAEAARIFAGALVPGRPAWDYAARTRGLDDATIRSWSIGYAGGDVAIGALRKKGFDDETLLAAGLLARRESDNSLYPFFRDRLVFPIRDRRGTTIGFGGRLLGPGEPKYLNSPASDVFDKSREVFGIDKAIAKGRRSGEAPARLVVGEGYFDVVALDAIGFRGVAPLGTALTEHQLGVLWRLDREPVLCFDGDAAGLRAMDRAIDRALPVIDGERTLRIARLPAGSDPDELLKAGQSETVIGAVESAIRLSDALFESCARGLDLRVPEDRGKCEAELRRRIDTIADPALRSSFADALIWDGLRRRARVPASPPASRGDRPAVRRTSGSAMRLPALPDPSAVARQVREDLCRAVVVCALRHRRIDGVDWETLSPFVDAGAPALRGALEDLDAFAASAEAAALLADTRLRRLYPFSAAEADSALAGRGIEYVMTRIRIEALETELAIPADSRDAAAWARHVELGRSLNEERERLNAFDEDHGFAAFTPGRGDGGSR